MGLALQPAGLGQQLQDLVGYHFRAGCGLVVVCTEVFQHQHKFITSQARHGITLANSHLQTCGYLPEQVIAHWMASGVVDLFEMVQVEKHHGAVKPAAAGCRERVAQVIGEQAAVG